MAKTGIISSYASDARKMQYADLIISEILDVFPDTLTAYDLGCGTGIYVAELERRGISTLGFELNALAFRQAKGPIDLMRVQDVGEDMTEKYVPANLVISFEVGEHLPPEKAEAFAKNLTGLAMTGIVLTASHEEGEFHLNPQPSQFWIDLIEASGDWAYDRQSSEVLCRFFDVKIDPPTTLRWFRTRTMIFRRKGQS